jgi:putative membrane protein
MDEIRELISHAPSFFGYFLIGLVFLGIHLLAYSATTKCDDLALIRQGNLAAACAITGSALGFSLPLSMAIVHAATAQAFAFWAVVAMVTQIGSYLFLKLVLKDVDAQIESSNPAYGVLMGGLSVVVGIINAACVI